MVWYLDLAHIQYITLIVVNEIRLSIRAMANYQYYFIENRGIYFY